jgi:integrase
LRGLLTKLRTSGTCRKRDLVDPITLLIATGLRRSELVGLRWSDVDDDGPLHEPGQGPPPSRRATGPRGDRERQTQSAMNVE